MPSTCFCSSSSIFNVSIITPTSRGDILRQIVSSVYIRWVKCLAEKMCLQARLKYWKGAGCTKVLRQCIPKLRGCSPECSCCRRRGNWSMMMTKYDVRFFGWKIDVNFSWKTDAANKTFYLPRVKLTWSHMPSSWPKQMSRSDERIPNSCILETHARLINKQTYTFLHY